MRLVLLLGLSLALNHCATETEAPTEAFYGAEFSTTDVRPAESLLATYGQEALRDSVRTTLRGTVNEVCQAKGCWMTLTAGNGQEMTVTFRDYGFFVPKDIGGKEVLMHGMAYTQLTPVEELRHFAADAGQSETEIAAITEPRSELRFLAEGVRVLPE
ncbi:uncharacterized protein DUF4920 [Neolewinella xylanilytica]|uniref:Uncharacterized protein DUF4920 n=1 Tax=Neolewinella xylanilytica TaxID=1514080 RepID=A0A2S6I387_9BACT|nr:DUF4920 domain-containing protein [Neolewinella xylanilytica]PPK85637.1 uncharacterized protein DUF4920 [Neolewinella xylanilytica]